MNYETGDIYHAHFPLEEDATKYTDRPLIIVASEGPELVVIKLTRTAPRANDPYDVQIQNYKESGLRHPSTARVSKVVTIDDSQLIFKIGKLHPEDLARVLNKLFEFTNR